MEPTEEATWTVMAKDLTLRVRPGTPWYLVREEALRRGVPEDAVDWYHQGQGRRVPLGSWSASDVAVYRWRWAECVEAPGRAL